MPNSCRIDFFFPVKRVGLRGYGGWRRSSSVDDGRPNILTWIKRFSANLDANARDKESAESLSQICELVVARTLAYNRRPTPTQSYIREDPPFSDEVLSWVLKACVDLNDKDMFVDAFDVCPYKAEPSTFRAVGRAFLRYGLESLLPKWVPRSAKVVCRY